MTLKERVFRVRDLLKEKERLLSIKRQAKEAELNLTQDWQKEIENLKRQGTNLKEIEKSIDEIYEELENHVSSFLEVLQDCRLEKLVFNLGKEKLIVRNSIQPFLLVEDEEIEIGVKEKSQKLEEPQKSPDWVERSKIQEETEEVALMSEILKAMKENNLEEGILTRAISKIAPNKSLETLSKKELSSLLKYVQKVIENREKNKTGATT